MHGNRGIRVALVDDERMMRDGLRALFRDQADIEIVAECDDAERLCDLIVAKRPHVVVLDIHPALNGTMALVPRIAHQWPEVRVVILSTCCSRAFVTEVLRGGARAYVVKRDCFDDLLEAVRAAAAGSVCLSASARQAIIDEYVERRPDSQTAHDPALTDRERTVLELIAEGRTSKEIGLILDLSSKTIDACRRQLMRKLEVNSVAGLVKCALMMGMTTLTA